jgi:hypothetical protein
MRPNQLMVRCYARLNNGVWEAFCIDFSLAAQGDSLDEAKTNLKAQIIEYVNEALTTDSDHFEELIARRAPLNERARWLALDLVGHLAHWRRLIKTYVQPLPMRVASAA